MANYGYSTPFQGFQQGLPAGYMQAATDPGRNIAAGINSFGDSMTAALERYSQRKDEGDFAQQRIENSLSAAIGAIQSGNIMDPSTHESQLMKTIMGITKTKDQDKLMSFASDIPGMALGKKKALAHDLEYGLKRYYDGKERQAVDDYRNVVTQQIRQEMSRSAGTINAQREALAIPTSETTSYENAPSVGVKDENGNVLAPAVDPGAPVQSTVTKPKSRTTLYKEISKVYADNNVPIPHEFINQHLDSLGVSQETPDGMVPVEMSTKTSSGSIRFENLDAITKAKMDQLAAAAKAAPLTVEQSKAVGFAQRLLFNEGVLKKVDAKGYDGSGLFDKVWTPEFYKKEERKSYESAKQNWIAAILRRESGAAISEPEYKNADKQYFPQLGDTKDVIQQKKALRDVEVRSLFQSAGPAGASLINDGKQRFKFNPTTTQLE